MKNKNQYSEY